MTHSSVPAPSPDQESLFAGTADDYARYRPGVPEAAVRLLADAFATAGIRCCWTWAPAPGRCHSHCGTRAGNASTRARPPS
ncbi:hypothetical protein ACFV8E_21225 [Streptomyces sp. NPDC059849]|uniref:hypothetical protein n=1 Tax=Streptomyces sp. NPDC059849 TaxID=3346969 RepID=UPI0036484683